MSDYTAKDPRCHVCYDQGCEHCPACAPRCLVCGAEIEAPLARLGSIHCGEHRRVRRLILTALGEV